MKPHAFHALVEATIVKIDQNQELYRNDTLDGPMVRSIQEQHSTLRRISGTALVYQSHLIEKLIQVLEDNLLLYAKEYGVEDLDDYINQI